MRIEYRFDFLTYKLFVMGGEKVFGGRFVFIDLCGVSIDLGALKKVLPLASAVYLIYSMSSLERVNLGSIKSELSQLEPPVEVHL